MAAAESGVQDFVALLAAKGVSEEDQLYDLCIQIENIVTSYDDRLDAFAESIQNATDAVVQRWDEMDSPKGTYEPSVHIRIDCTEQSLSVVDNGCGVASDHFNDVFRPNLSLKRRLRHKSARGEKGAGVVFLQFAHSEFSFETKLGEFSRGYRVSNGRAWFTQALETLNYERPFEEKRDALPGDPHEFFDNVSDELASVDQGSRTFVRFSSEVNHPEIATIFATPDSAFKRLEYLCRTRTAVGLFKHPDTRDIHPCLLALKVTASITFPDGTQQQGDIPTGFLFPHLLADAEGAPSSHLTDPKIGSELMFDFFDAVWLKQYLPDFFNGGNELVGQKYQIQGYVSYAYNNPFYETQGSTYLELGDGGDDQLRDELVQVNGGFQICVREYPNGRRHAFLHRSGAEDKSRTYVICNFRGAYKPDYGRKNVSDEVRPFVKGLCKALINWATAKDRKEKLRTPTSNVPHQVRDVEAAREMLAQLATAQGKVGPWIDASVAPSVRARLSRTEQEIVAEFVGLVAGDALPGYRLYELTGGMLDCMFDFALKRIPPHIYSEDVPLGLKFPEGADVEYSQQWLEFKVSSDQLCDDFAKPPGKGARKFFTTIHLLVCQKVDDAVDGYTVDEINDDNLNERRYYGVTHLLRSEGNREHTIRIIELIRLRSLLGTVDRLAPGMGDG